MPGQSGPVVKGLVCVLSVPGAPTGPADPAVQSSSWSDGKYM